MLFDSGVLTQLSIFKGDFRKSLSIFLTLSDCEIDNLTLYLIHPHVFGDRCYSKYPWKALSFKNAYETEFMICFAFSILVLNSFVPISIKRMIRRTTRWSEVVKGQKNNDQREVIQCYLMTYGRQISRVSPGFCRFLNFQAHFLVHMK